MSKKASATLGLLLATSFGIPWASWAADITLDKTTSYDGLTIPDGAQIIVPPGKVAVMSVDGVETAITPGTYAGKVVLTVTEPILVKYRKLAPHPFRAAIMVTDGRIDQAHSAPAAVAEGTVTDQAAKGVHITSRDEKFNGILVGGSSHYEIDDPVIEMTGNGGNDFAGFGAALMSTGDSDVTVHNARIRTTGVVRTAVFVGGHSTMRLDHADIEARNGIQPPGYKFTLAMGQMFEVPWMLGLTGNVRATNLVDHGTVYYTDSHIRAQGWGALSTDDAAHVRMYVKNCLIETIDSGYGAYSIGDSVDSFSHSTFNVADMALIMAVNGSGIFTDGTVVNSRRFGVLMHSGVGGGQLIIERGSVFNTRSTAIQVKGRGSTILIDESKIHAGNGVILQAMENDDPYATASGGPPPGIDLSDLPPADPNAPIYSPDVVATIRNADLTGDFLNTRTSQGGLSVTLEKARVTGAISTGTQAPLTGEAPTAQTYWLIGAVTNSLGASHDKNGTSVSVDGASRWIVTQSSYLTALDLAQGGKIEAAPGYRLSLSVDGKRVPLAAGHYKGDVRVTVAPLS